MPGRVSDLPVDSATLRQLSVESGTDPRSLAKILRGESVRGMAGHRARDVLVKHGLLPEPKESQCA